jgi:hypothetical protein
MVNASKGELPAFPPKVSGILSPSSRRWVRIAHNMVALNVQIHAFGGLFLRMSYPWLSKTWGETNRELWHQDGPLYYTCSQQLVIHAS